MFPKGWWLAAAFRARLPFQAAQGELGQESDGEVLEQPLPVLREGFWGELGWGWVGQGLRSMAARGRKAFGSCAERTSRTEHWTWRQAAPGS